MTRRPRSPRGSQTQRPTGGAIPPESGWARLWRFIKRIGAVAKTIGAALAAVTAWYAVTLLKIDADRERRRAAIDATTSRLRHDTTPEANRATLDSLSSAGLAEHLEPLAIAGLVLFIKDKTRSSSDCLRAVSPDSSTRGLKSENVDKAFGLIRVFQSAAGGRIHSYPDRVIDAMLAFSHGEHQAPAAPFDLHGADLRRANLRGVDLRSASLERACLAYASLNSAILSDASFLGARLDSATLDSATLDGTSFERASLRFTSLQTARGVRTNFDRSDLTAADLSFIRLDSAYFHGATLSCATIGNAMISHAYFSGAIAHWTYFGGDTLLEAQHWNEIRGLRGAFLAQVVGLSDEMRKLAVDSGAAPDAVDQGEWVSRKDSQRTGHGPCSHE